MSMINLYDCEGHESTAKELKFLVESLVPWKELPKLNKNINLNDYYIQLAVKNYLDTLLEGDTLRFLVNRYIKENLSGVDWLIANLGSRLRYIIDGITDAIKRRGLDLSFHWNDGRLLLYNYELGYDKPFSNREPRKLCRLVMKKVLNPTKAW